MPASCTQDCLYATRSERDALTLAHRGNITGTTPPSGFTFLRQQFVTSTHFLLLKKHLLRVFSFHWAVYDAMPGTSAAFFLFDKVLLDNTCSLAHNQKYCFFALQKRYLHLNTHLARTNKCCACKSFVFELANDFKSPNFDLDGLQSFLSLKCKGLLQIILPPFMLLSFAQWLKRGKKRQDK